MSEGMLRENLMDVFHHGKDNIAIEDELNRICRDFMCEEVSFVMETLDDSLMQQMKAQGFQIERSDTRSVQFMFGEVTFKRRLYKRGVKTQYALDERMGFDKYVKYTPGVKANMAYLATRMSYAKAEEATRRLTPIDISANTIHRIVANADEAIHTYTYNEQHDGLPEAKQVPVIYVEGDGLQLHLRNNERKELARFQVHEGSKKIGKSRRKCKNMMEFSDFSSAKAKKQLDNYLQQTYDLSKTVVITSSDGGSGYAPETFEDFAVGALAHEHFIDSYHVHRKIEERMWFCPKLTEKMRKAIWKYSELDRDAVLDAMEYIASERGGDQEKDDARLLRDYFDRNWAYMKPMQKREMPVSHRGMGVAESNHRPHSYRMKKQGRVWGKTGGNAMAHVIDAQRNGTLFVALSNTWKIITSVSQDETPRRTQVYLKDVPTAHTIGDPNKGLASTYQRKLKY